MGRARGFDDKHYYALAGFFDAEGHFAVSARDGLAPQCSASIGLRDDDGEILHRFRHATGLGRIRATPAQARARPQLRWTIGTKRECQALAKVFDRYPLLGRKRFEAQVWADAVERWCGPAGSERTRLLHSADAQLRRLRAYHDTFDDSPANVSRRHLVSHFGGFFSGDGSLALDPGRRRAQVLVRLRRDDTALLRTYQSAFGFGKVIPVAAGVGQNPVVLWHVTARAELRKALRVLDEAPLLGLKRAQYEAWRPAAVELVGARAEERPADMGVLVDARKRLTEIRAYEVPVRRYATSSCEGDDDHLSIYVDVLRSWSQSHQGELSCTAYSAARRSHAEWPTRGTLVANFGSWRLALDAAGLEHRAVNSGRRVPSE